MSRPLTPLVLSRLSGGINRFEVQAAENQCVEALDVIEDDGDVRRRDAFQAIAAGPSHPLPAGKTVVATTSSSITTLQYNRTFTQAVDKVGGLNGDIFVGCDEQFDGIDWGHVTATLTDVSANRYLQACYWNGSTWVPFVAVDFTRKRFVIGGDIFFQTLCKDGRISWHTSQFAASWTTLAVGGLTKYWIRLAVVAPTTPSSVGAGVLSGSGSLVMTGQGPRAILLEPVRAIFPLRLGYGIDSILIAGDRRAARGSELGAAMAHWKSLYDGPENLHIIEDEGSGVFGQVSFPAAVSGTTGSPAAGYTTPNAAAPSAFGTSGNVLTRNRLAGAPPWMNDTNHVYDLWRGAVVKEAVAPTGGLSNSATTKSGSFTVSITGLKANQLEHFRLRCVTKGAGGTPLGEEREITSNTAGAVSYHDHFSIAPDTDNRFDIIRPHSRLFARQSDLVEGMEIFSNGADIATLVSSSRPFQSTPDLSNEFVHWEIGRDLAWRIAGAPFWTGMFNITNKQFVLTNGPSGLLNYDGLTLRRFEALSDPTNATVQKIIGALDDTDIPSLNSKSIAGSQLRNTPATGPYVTDFHGRIVVASGFDVSWSFPAIYEDIWPRGYTTQIRDSENQPITGMATLNDRLMVWTPTSIHAADEPDDDGILRFTPVSQGIGFLSQRSVCKIIVGGSSALIGVGGDGVKLLANAGNEPQDALDDWRRLIEGGVNSKMLHNAVGGVSKHRNEYYIAFPSQGSQVNDRIGVYNYASRKWWLWSTPWGGVSAIATDYDQQGQERVLFGFEDGHVAVLVKAQTDDGDVVTGFAKAPVQAPIAGRTVAATALMVTALETGPVQTLTVSTYLNRRSTPAQEHFAAFDDGADAFDGSEKYGPVTGVNVQAVYAGEPLVTKKINLPAGSTGERVQFSIEGTGLWKFRMCEVLLAPKGYRSH